MDDSHDTIRVYVYATEGRLLLARGLHSRPPTDIPAGGRTTMRSVLRGRGAVEAAERELSKILIRHRVKQHFIASGCLFVLGFVLLIVPVVGWIMGIVLVIGGALGMIFPAAAYSILSRREYEALLRPVSYRVRNCYVDVVCPYCGISWTKGEEAFCFDSNPEGLDCAFCNHRVIRNGDVLTAQA
ncbi:MAG TPA: hypothetical protein VK747_18350 [Blastocatellia bacterium]|nr:hypothetical protein [Blastocatellia bacterium]